MRGDANSGMADASTISLHRVAAGSAPIASNSTYVVPPEKRTTEYLESIIGPEIEKNGAPIKAAGMSVE